MAINWFPHDSAAGMDQHVLMLRSEWGNAGYGMFWLALEAMYETADGTLDAAALPALSIRMAEDRETVIRFFDYCLGIGLFVKKDGKIFSERLLTEKSQMLAKSEAQRKRAEHRWEKEKNKKSNATALPGQSAGNAPTVHNQHNQEYVCDTRACEGEPAAPPPAGDVCVREGGVPAGDKADVRRQSEHLIAAWTGYGLASSAQDLELLCPSAGFLVQFEPEMPAVAETYGQAVKAVRTLNERLTSSGKPKLKTFAVHSPLNFHQMFLARAAGGRRTWRDYVGKDAWYVLDADDQKRVRAALESVPDLLKDFPAFV